LPPNIARLFRYALFMHWTRTGVPFPAPRILAALLLALGSFAAMGCAPDTPARPDLILITIDRLAADRLACFGGPAGAGSRLCELADGGTLFAWATTPALAEAPAAASALTGLEPRAHGLDDRGLSFLADRHETIAESLARAGYTTAAFVASERLNRSRRLDQGFAHYADPPPPARVPRSAIRVTEPDAIERWIEETRRPYFVWIHTQAGAGLGELDRLIDRLAHRLRDAERRPGVLLVALAGERDGERSAADSNQQREGIELRSHRIPLIWRAPSSTGAGGGEPAPRVIWRLASVLDVPATLRAAASVPPRPRLEGERRGPLGRDLTTLLRPQEAIAGEQRADGGADDERFLLLRERLDSGEVGIASGPHLYVRPASPRDGSGRPMPTSELPSLGARFVTIAPPTETARETGRIARLEPRPWRRDVLSTSSPVPRLEFHLARKLADLPAE
jgi:arylsulfatase A-like enzyme